MKKMTADGLARKRAAMADPDAREFLRNADPVLARLIDARPDFRPRAWMDELPPLDAFGTLVFQVAGQQLSVGSTRAIISPAAAIWGPPAVAGRAACGRPHGAAGERVLDSKRPDVASAGAEVRRRTAER